MSLDRLYPAIGGDLRITPCRPDDDYAFALSRTDTDDEGVLVAVVPDGAAYGIGEAQGYAVLLARSPTMLRLLGPWRRSAPKAHTGARYTSLQLSVAGREAICPGS